KPGRQEDRCRPAQGRGDKRLSLLARAAAPPRGASLLNNLLNHLEEWLIATLIAVATTIVFFAVLHRYGTSASIDYAKWLDAHGMTSLGLPLRALFRLLSGMDVSWAQ